MKQTITRVARASTHRKYIPMKIQIPTLNPSRWTPGAPFTLEAARHNLIQEGNFHSLKFIALAVLIA